MTTTRTRLTTDQKMAALACLARGDTLSQTAAYILETYSVTISESALSKIKKDHRVTLERMITLTADGEAAAASAILDRSRRMINKKLDRAERDQNELEYLAQQYRDGDIDHATYRKKKMGLMRISITELNNVSKTMFSQTHGAPADPALPQTLTAGGAPTQTPAHLEALLKAVAAGNTVEVQRLVFTPGAARNDQHITV